MTHELLAATHRQRAASDARVPGSLLAQNLADFVR